MFKFSYAIVLLFIFNLPAIPGNCRAYVVSCGYDFNYAPIPAGDTIYQIDTIYQYEIIYDTLYYYNTIPKADTLMVYDTLIEDTDSTVVVRQLLSMNVKKKKTVFAYRDFKFPDNTTREFSDPEKSKDDKKFNSPETDQGRDPHYAGRNNTSQTEGESNDREGIFTYQVRDTIYRYDTIINTETIFDTVFFAANAQFNDTSFTNHTEYEKFGRSVLVKEIVIVKVSKKENMFLEKSGYQTGTDEKRPGSRRNKNLANTSPVNNRKWKRDLKHASRSYQNNINTDYSIYLRAGVSVFIPDIDFSSKNTETAANVRTLNSNSSGELSYGAWLTYNYFNKNLGFETGLIFSRHNFSYCHHYMEPGIDTSYYWDYFNNEAYRYDTTWYINLDTLLQTGDTLLVPSVDSTMIQVIDSTYQTRLDTTFLPKSEKYHYSYSYLEIPIIGKFSVLDGKFFMNIAAGALPSFLISKSGNMLSVETNTIIETKGIAFDYGFSLAVYGALDLGFRMSDRCAIHVEPYFKKNVFSTIKNDHLLIRTDAWGVNFGISYRLISLNE